MKKSISNIIVYVLKMLMYIGLLLTFLIIFGMDNQAVLKPSRTMATTTLTFMIVGLLMVAIYGKYDVGRRKSKPIIYSLVLAAILTDIITYAQLMIMNTIQPDVRAFRLTNILELLLVMGIQVLLIIAFVYLGNGIYFRINPPEKCCIITSRESDLDKLSKGIKKYKKQYKVMRVIYYRRTDIESIIATMDTVIMYNVPMSERTDIVNYCYEHLINIYINPEITDIVENLARH